MRANAIAAFEASGLDERYRGIAEMAASGDAFASELLDDAIRTRAARVAGLVTFPEYQRRCAIAERANKADDEMGAL